MLDYAANGSAFWQLDQLRGWFEGDDPQAATGHLVSWLDSAGEDPEEVAAQFWDAAGANLREGKVRLVFVADEIPASLQRLVEFLNEQMPRVEVLAVEIRQCRAAGSKSGALVSRVVGQTSRAQATKQRPAPSVRRAARWTAEEVLEQIGQTGEEAAAVASVVHGWAQQHPHVEISGGTEVSYPSILMSADSGREQSRYRGVLVLYASPPRETPGLEIRIKRMCRTPHTAPRAYVRLVADLQGWGIPRLDTEDALTGKRPNIPLGQLTDGRAGRLLALVDQWIDDIRAHAAEPEPADKD